MDMENTTIKKVSITILLLLMASATLFAFYIVWNQPDEIAIKEEKKSQDYHSLRYEGTSYSYQTSILNILLLGIDTNQKENLQGQADAIELVLLDRKEKHIKVLSIPRDTMSEIRMFDLRHEDLGWQREHLNLAYAYGMDEEGGCMYTAQAVSRMLGGIPVSRYAALNMDMLGAVHEIVGNLDVVMPNDTIAGWPKGSTQTITTENVETFLRTRDTDANFSDLERMQRQETYFKAYFQKLKDLLQQDYEDTVEKMFDIAQQITTNISYTDMEDFADMILTYAFDETSDYLILPGSNTQGYLHDEYEIDEKAFAKMKLDLFYHKEGKQ